MSLWNYLTVITSVLLIILILLQTRGAGLGAGLGGSAEVNTTRRGSDKTLHQLTIILVFIFAASVIITVVEL